jgi:hypothetical protein
MLRLCGTNAVSLPAHRCFSTLRQTHRAIGHVHSATKGRSSPSSAAAVSPSNNRRHLLQAGFAGLVSMAVFGSSSSTALAAGRVEQVVIFARHLLHSADHLPWAACVCTTSSLGSRARQAFPLPSAHGRVTIPCRCWKACNGQRSSPSQRRTSSALMSRQTPFSMGSRAM